MKKSKTPPKKSGKKIKKSKPFSKLSKPQKRVAIAQDVIQQIKIGRYIASTGSYVYGMNFTDGTRKIHNLGKDIKKNFEKIRNCTVCAMGACLMSVTKFQNKLTFEDVGMSIHSFQNDKVKLLFESLFSPSQLLLIERAFEGDSGGSTVGVNIFGLSEDEFQESIHQCSSNFYHKYDDESERLIAIMENIVRNKGTFKPEYV